jgi:hypothetical protein
MVVPGAVSGNRTWVNQGTSTIDDTHGMHSMKITYSRFSELAHAEQDRASHAVLVHVPPEIASVPDQYDGHQGLLLRRGPS